MQIRATNVFANELSKQLKANNNYCIDSVILVKIPRETAYMTVGGGYSDIDIDWKDNSVKVLKIIYKSDCYAIPKYVTTNELNKLCKGIDLTMENYIEAFQDAYNI